MKLQTPIEIPQPLRLIGLKHRVAFIGSCFAENIGSRMRQSGLPALVNPFGVLFNPQSILQVMTQDLMRDDLYFEDSDHRWHCWLTDSSKNASSREACQAAVLSARGRLFGCNADTVVVTLGTNRYYSRNSLIVGNCHKQPQAEFTEKDMNVQEAADALDAICQLFPSAQMVFTVSPYRYAKYGFHESRLSKAVLLLAVDEVIRRHPGQACYFPAYELQLDELRDYRFYAEDMLHPSAQAIDYIWERFADRWMDAETHRYLVDYEPIRRALQHRPEDPGSPASIRFSEQTQQRLNSLMAKYNIEP